MLANEARAGIVERVGVAKVIRQCQRLLVSDQYKQRAIGNRSLYPSTGSPTVMKCTITGLITIVNKNIFRLIPSLIKIN